MTTLQLTDCKTDHLFVLVGGNTLPNYVAIKLLADKNTHIYLVYSQDKTVAGGRVITGTSRQMLAIKKALNPDPDNIAYPCLIEVPITDELSPTSIENAIKSCLEKITGQVSVGLHYTGGTKTMAVHAYLALREAEKNYTKVCYSYLDARLLALWIELSDLGKTNQPIPVWNKLDVSLDEILKLHNREHLKEDMRTQTVWEEVARGLTTFVVEASKKRRRKWQKWCIENLDIKDESIRQEQLLKKLLSLTEEEMRELAKFLAETSDDCVKAWRSWYNKHLKANGSDYEKNEQLQQKFLELTTDTLPQHSDLKHNVYAPLERVIGLSFESKPLLKDLVEKSPFTKSTYPYLRFADWLKGGWLEDYVFMHLEQIKTDCSLHSLAMNIMPKIDKKDDTLIDTSNNEEERNFEFDVAAMRGYQLLAFSCTTSDQRGMCKSKLLETVARARQLGGSEARIALVCCYADPDDLQYEVDALVSDNQVKVFGLGDLLDLGEKIKAWL